MAEEMVTRPEFPEHLAPARAEIERLARKCGASFNQVIFEMVDSDEMSAIAAYGGYTKRVHHWKYGEEYLQQQRTYRFGLGKIYELVVPSNPCYAYLMSNNNDASQKTVMAHVFFHADFFKNNPYFADIPFNLHNLFADNAELLEAIRHEVGKDKVDLFLDACYSLDNLYDPSEPFVLKLRPKTDEEKPQREPKRIEAGEPMPDYMEDVLNPPEWIAEQRRELEKTAKLHSEIKRGVKIPSKPVRDILGFLLLNAPLEPWQQEVVRIVREESLAFKGNWQTKIMNEGWAAYWHCHIMAELGVASDAEIVAFGDMNAGVLSGGGAFNPYSLGLRLWRDIKWRWDTGRHGHIWEDCSDTDILNRYEDFIVFKTLFDKNAGYNEKCRREWDEYNTLLHEIRQGRGLLNKAFFFPETHVSEWLNYLRADALLKSLETSRPEHWSQKEVAIEIERCHSYLKIKQRFRNGEVKAPKVEVPPSWLDWAGRNTFDGKLGEGTEKMFKVRATYDDYNFIHEFFTKDFCRKHKYFTVGVKQQPNYDFWRVEERYVIETRDYLRVKKFLLDKLLNRGEPKAVLYDANFNNNGELRLIHIYDGRNLDFPKIPDVLERLYRVWAKEKPVHLETMILFWPKGLKWYERWVPPGYEQPKAEPPAGRWVRYTYNGKKLDGEVLVFDELEQNIVAMLPFIPEKFI